MAVVRMVEVIADEVVDVIAVRHRLVTAAVAVLMRMIAVDLVIAH
jgi:hypothetical protein